MKNSASEDLRQTDWCYNQEPIQKPLTIDFRMSSLTFSKNLYLLLFILQ